VTLDALLEWLFSAEAPDDARQKARLLVLDTVGCALAGLAHPSVRRFAKLLNDDGALLAMAACWDEACEGLARAHGRPGVPVIAACFARGAKANFGQLLEAVITGYEVGGRMGEALRMRPGMHVDAAWPSLGVAAAVARLEGGSPALARAAIEIAACQIPYSLYLPIEQGADGRNTYLGHAAWLGSYAALAALAGCAAPHGAVQRYAELVLGTKDMRLAPPGAYVILESYVKPFAAVRHVHYGAEAALRLRPRIADTTRIRAISLSVYPEALVYCANRAPHTPIQAQFSLSFGVAAALRFGRLDASVYRAECFHEPELRRLEAMVATSSEGGADRAATLSIEYDGMRMQEHVTAIPMTPEACRAKFISQAAPHLGEHAAQRLADALLQGPESQSIESILPRELYS
jgi:2-methylcitrate dehydratase PrpD